MRLTHLAKCSPCRSERRALARLDWPSFSTVAVRLQQAHQKALPARQRWRVNANTNGGGLIGYNLGAIGALVHEFLTGLEEGADE